MTRAIAVALLAGLLALAAARSAGAQPAGPDAGYIGRDVPQLEIDDCRPSDLSKDEVVRQGSEHYTRGATLYVQGDYEGAVREFVYGYCLVPSFYTILKDIGQAYERNLDYERAIGYLERYVKAVPPDARRAEPCAVDPQEDKANVARRVEVLRRLKARIHVESSPPGARITIANDAGVAARARSGDPIDVLGGRYEMITELDGYEPHRQAIDVRIGKPYTYFVPLVAQKGRLSMQVLPADARIFLGDRLVGIGSVDLALEGNTYVVTSEAPDRITDRRQIQVIANQVKRVQVSLTAKPQLGRRQLIAFSTLAGGAAAGSMLFAFQGTRLATLGSVGGGAAGFFGSTFLLPDDLALGPSNLTITATVGGVVLGAGATLLFTNSEEILAPVVGATAAVTGTFGYLMGTRTRLTTGDAALINSGVVWGSAAGGLFSLSFGSRRGPVTGGLVLSGLGMGAVGGVLLQRNFTVSRTRAALIDVGGLIGVIAGLSASSVFYPSDALDDQTLEHLGNFALGGMAVGLLTAGILTRQLDSPAMPAGPGGSSPRSSSSSSPARRRPGGPAVALSVTPSHAPDGRATPLYGLRGTW